MNINNSRIFCLNINPHTSTNYLAINKFINHGIKEANNEIINLSRKESTIIHNISSTKNDLNEILSNLNETTLKMKSIDDMSSANKKDNHKKSETNYIQKFPNNKIFHDIPNQSIYGSNN